MRMTEEEIRRELRLSKNIENQIKILADMNCTTPKIIKRVNMGQTWGEATERRYRKPYYIPKTPTLYKHWTIEELKQLKKMQEQHVPRKEMAEQLKRSLGSINGAINYIKSKGVEKYELG